MAVDKTYLKENNLEDVYKRMRQINEYVITHGNMEADNMQQDQNTEMPQDNNQPVPPAPEQPQQEMPQDQQTPQDNMPQEEPAPASEPDPTIGAEAPDAPADDTVEDVDIETEEGPSDDEVIDVDDLTNSQEAAEYKIDGVDDKLSKLLSIVGKFEKAIEDNDKKLNDLKTEFEKRNPTDIEKINIRSQNSQPFNVNPGEYWETVKEKNPNYNVVSDNTVAPNEEDKVYTITNDDLKDFNSREIEKSFSDFPKDLMDYFK